MARPITWAIRITLTDGRTVFARNNRQIGSGPLATYRTKNQADLDAHWWSGKKSVRSVEVFERSHGRQFPEAGRGNQAGNQGTHPAPENKELSLCETCGSQVCVYQGHHP